MNFNPFEHLWLGTNESLNRHISEQIFKIQTPPSEVALVEERAKAAICDEQANKEPEFGDGSCDWMMSRQGNLAIIHIQGVLVTGRADWWDKYTHSAVGYEDIRNALVTAAEDPSIHGIVQDMATPGGHASGIMEVSDLIFDINTDHKPVFTFTGTSMCSGGYWLGCSGQKIFASRMAHVGSIGVIMTHASFFRMYEERGIDLKVIRSGRYKALGGPHEKLSTEALSTLQAECDEIHNIFLEHVGEQRGMSVASFKESAGEGQVFLAEKAVDEGLIDVVASFDDAIEVISKKCAKQHDKQGYTTTAGANPIMAKGTKVLSKKDQAALASGVPEEQVNVAPAAEGNDDSQLAEETGGTPTIVEEHEVKNPENDPPEGALEVTASESISVMELIAQIAALTSQVTDLNRDKKELEATCNSLVAGNKGLHDIAVQATERLQIACGQAASAGLKELTDSGLIQTYQKSYDTFLERFPVGAKAKVPDDNDINPEANRPDATQSMATKKGMTL